ncbi:MAG TPA: amidohydrolase family protein [Ktedonobacteraceae bacterium]|nr:amidohydrolase family protein [Ktedonobacteraceae bacterium]
MLDLSAIPVVDNHCHPVLLNQSMDALRFRRYFTEASDPILAEQHVENTVYYLWMLRQMAMFYGCSNTEDALIAARNRLDSESLIERLFRAANIDTLVLDQGVPLPENCLSPEQMGQLGHCRALKLLRLETLMQRLVVDYGDFDELVERFEHVLSDLRANGYSGLKSIVAYRGGLQVLERTRDEAITAFREARSAIRNRSLRISQKPLIDYLLFIAFRHAAEQGLPIQFHTGYGDSDTDMRLGNPLHLRDVLERGDLHNMKVVLLHESYPYSQFGAYLAAIYPHVYFDLSYTIPYIDRLEMLAFTRQALSIAPASKLMYSSDGTNIPEMHWASAIRGRSIIGQVLSEMVEADEIDEQQGYHLAQLILRDTAYSVYEL